MSLSAVVFKKIVRFPLIVTLLFVASMLRGESLVLPEVVSAGNTGLQPFLKQIPVRDLAHYGFASTNEFPDCSLGIPLRIYTILPRSVLKFDGSGDLLSMLVPTDSWLCPILAGGRNRALLTVAYVDQTWKAVAVGGADLAVELGEMMKKWPAADGCGYIFVRVFQARSDFLVVYGKGDPVMVPLTSAALALNLPMTDSGGSRSLDFTDVIQRLKAPVEQGLGDNQ